MDEMEREDMRHDMEIDSRYSKYMVTVTVTIEVPVTATDTEDAKDTAYDIVEEYLHGSHLDYEYDFDAEEMDD